MGSRCGICGRKQLEDKHKKKKKNLKNNKINYYRTTPKDIIQKTKHTNQKTIKKTQIKN